MAKKLQEFYMNGQEWTRMDKNGQEWTRMYCIVCLLLKHLPTLLAYAALKVDKSVYRLHFSEYSYRIYISAQFGLVQNVLLDWVYVVFTSNFPFGFQDFLVSLDDSI